MRAMKEELIRKYMDGTAKHEEAHKLLGLLQKESSLTPQERGLKDLLQLESDRLQPRQEWMQEDESVLFDSMVQRRQRAGIVQWLLPVAAMITIVWMVSAIVTWEPVKAEATVTYIYGNRIENGPLAMDMMRETMSELLDRPALEDDMGRLLGK